MAGNAIKFTEKGEVLVEIARQSEREGSVELHFKITDTGIGIPAEKHHLLFRAFTQADSSTTRKYGGTGLGLAISARLVELMGGKIWLESAEGKGSTFHFTVCYAKQPLKTETPLPAPAADLNDVPVLVVDDNETNRRILYEMTSRWGMKPLAVDSGPAALAALEAGGKKGDSFPIILMDAHMPGMDGFQPYSLGSSQTIHLRHLDIHERQVELLAEGERQGLFPGTCENPKYVPSSPARGESRPGSRHCPRPPEYGVCATTRAACAGSQAGARGRCQNVRDPKR